MELIIDLEPEALRRAESLAAERGQTIGKVLSDALLGRIVPDGYPKVVVGPSGLPEIHLGRPVTLDEVREAIEDED